MAKEVPVGDGGVVLVDDEDYPLIARFRWFLVKGATTKYAARRLQIGHSEKNRRTITLMMHRLIAPCDPGCMIDHRDGDGLNNQKANLRIVTNSQNQMNRKLGLRNKTSRFKGVSRNRRLGKWHAYIKIGGRRRHIGFFDSEEAAALAYDREAVREFGEYARPNFPEATHV